MRRAGNLIASIAHPQNLRLAFRKALRGKRHRRDVRDFARYLDTNLAQMANEIVDGTITVGRSHQFTIFDPKRRTITAPVFCERVLHHAIINICEPIFERFLIDQTFACRIGKGRSSALQCAQRYAAIHGWYLKMDIRKYFDSIPHDQLLDLLSKRIKCRPALRLFARIIQAHSTTAGAGLPIGALTSQHLANFYLGHLDRFVKEHLRAKGYVRYMDDFVLWGHESGKLKEYRDRIASYLTATLSLHVKQPCIINRTKKGMSFLGCWLTNQRIFLSRRSRARFVKRLRMLEQDYAAGRIGEFTLQLRATSLLAFVQSSGTDSRNFRRRVVHKTSVSGYERFEPCDSRG